MKQDTIDLLKSYLDQKKFEFAPTDDGLELKYELTDDEKLKLVELEYGTKLTGTVDELFVAIMKKLVKLAVEKAKEEAGA
jgi:hypothetical protein